MIEACQPGTDKTRGLALTARICRQECRFGELRAGRVLAQCEGMTTFTELASVPSDPMAPFTDQLRLAVAAYLARFKGISRNRTESDLRCYLSWCAEHGLDPLAARRPHLELYIRWMQEIDGSSPPPSPAASRSRPGSTAPAPWMASCRIHRPNMCAARPCPPNRPRSGSRICSSRPCSPPPGSP